MAFMGKGRLVTYTIYDTYTYTYTHILDYIEILPQDVMVKAASVYLGVVQSVEA